MPCGQKKSKQKEQKPCCNKFNKDFKNDTHQNKKNLKKKTANQRVFEGYTGEFFYQIIILQTQLCRYIVLNHKKIYIWKNRV